MIIKKATQIGNPVIRQEAEAVADVESKETKEIVKNLVDSMRYHGLVGMAAPQIGEGKRIFVTEIRETEFRSAEEEAEIDNLRVFINPEIISTSENTNNEWEGCGSVADANLFGKVTRPSEVIIKALDEKGEEFELAAKGLLARVIQHEMDHINGVVFIDKSDPKTFMSGSEYMKLKDK